MADGEAMNIVQTLIAKYAKNDSLDDAIRNVDQAVFDEQRDNWPEGVPGSVNVQAMLRAQEDMLSFVVHLVMSALQETEGWTDATRLEQERLALGALRIVRDDTILKVLVTTRQMNDAK